VVTAGWRHGGLRPLSVTLNEGVFWRSTWTAAHERRVETRYCDMVTEDPDEALRLCEAACVKAARCQSAA